MRTSFLFLILAILTTASFAQSGGSKPQPILVDVIGGRSGKTAASRTRGARNNAPRIANAFERRAFELMNNVRLARGLSRLSWDERLAKIARLHSKDMASAGFLNHQGSDGSMVDDRAATFGIRNWMAIGENIAFLQGYDDPAALAVEKWMKSKSHKKNILNAQWSESAIGVASTADGMVYFTQVFITR